MDHLSVSFKANFEVYKTQFFFSFFGAMLLVLPNGHWNIKVMCVSSAATFQHFTLVHGPFQVDLTTVSCCGVASELCPFPSTTPSCLLQLCGLEEATLQFPPWEEGQSEFKCLGAGS